MNPIFKADGHPSNADGSCVRRNNYNGSAKFHFFFVPPVILHVSDLHPEPAHNLSGLAPTIFAAVKGVRVSPDYVVASGDLGNKGQNQRMSGKFLLELASKFGLSKEQIVCVPGNHDVQKTQPLTPFHNYSAALYEITKDSKRSAVKSVDLYRHRNVEFLLVNSAYHLETEYGRVDCDELRNVVANSSADKSKVVVVHHNSIPVSEHDRSTIINAYEFLTIISSMSCGVVLHGHQHLSLSLIVGPQTKLVGAGTLNFTPSRNVNNQFNVVDVGKSVFRFRYHADSSTSQGFGNWDSERLTW